MRGVGKQVPCGAVMKANLVELADEFREEVSRSLRKELTGVVQGVSGKRRFLVKFQDGCEKGLTSNILAAVVVGRIPVTKEAELPTIYDIPYKIVDLEKGYYHFFYVLLQFSKDGSADSKEEQVDMEEDPDEDDM